MLTHQIQFLKVAIVATYDVRSHEFWNDGRQARHKNKKKAEILVQAEGSFGPLDDEGGYFRVSGARGIP